MEILNLKGAKAKIIDFSQVKYMEIVNELTQDIRIFMGVNGFVFLIFLLISLLKSKAIVHLFVPGVLLASTISCSYFYLFEQNWFFTILCNDYTGYTYLSYLVIVFGVLCDIALNRGRITTKILNAFFNAIGNTINAMPC